MLEGNKLIAFQVSNAMITKQCSEERREAFWLSRPGWDLPHPVGMPNCRSQFAIFGFVWNLGCEKTKESVNCLFGLKKM